MGASDRCRRRAWWLLWVSVALPGCEGTLALRSALSDIRIEPSHLDFGPTAVGGNRTLELTLTNDGIIDADISSLWATHEAVWLEREEGTPLHLRAGARERVRVHFRPSFEGAVTAGVRVLREEAMEAEEIPADGLGVRARIEAGERLEFGAVEVGAVVMRELALRNVSETEARVSTTLGGAAPTNFELESRLRLDARATGKLPIAFRPDRLGDIEAEVQVQACEAGCEPRRVVLHGTGVSSDVELSPSRVDFGLVSLGALAEKRVTVRNIGTEPLSLVGVSNESGDAGEDGDRSFFEVRPQTEARALPPGGHAELVVRFLPTEAGVHEGRVALRFDAARLGVLRIPLSGEGGNGCLVTLPRRVDYGTVPVGAQVVRDIEVHNRCPEAVHVRSSRIASSAAALSPFEALPFAGSTLEPGTRALWSVRFSPLAVGAMEASLEFESEENGRTVPGRIPLSGAGESFGACRWEVRPNQVDFGRIGLENTAMLGVAVKNVGPGACFLESLDLSAGTPNVFSADALRNLALGAGETAFLPVRFRSTTPGAFDGEVEGRFFSHGTFRVPLIAESIASCLVMSPSRLDFGTGKVGCSARSLPLHVRNRCEDAVSVSGLGFRGATSADATEFATPDGTSFPFTLVSGQERAIDLVYTPKNDGADFSAVELQTTEGALGSSLLGRGLVRGEKVDSFRQALSDQVDVLFVIDNSGSMMEEQQSLAQNFSAFLSSAQANFVDYQIGVTTTGLTRSPGGWTMCPGGVDGGENGRLYPVRGDGPRIITPRTPNAAQVFANNVQVGWCHWNEQGLEAAYRALTPPLITNADDLSTPEPNDGNRGFLRPGAKLSIVFVTDEEDFSPGSLDFYETFFRGLKPNPEDVTISAITGLETLSACPTASSTGSRYLELARGSGGVVESICTADWSRSLQKLSASSFGPNRRFALTSPLHDASALQVEVEGVRLGHGWHYDAASHSVVFDSVPPPAGSAVRVRYPVGCD